MSEKKSDDEIFWEIVGWCEEYECYSYAKLIDSLSGRFRKDWWDVMLNTRATAIIGYLEAKRRDKKAKEKEWRL